MRRRAALLVCALAIAAGVTVGVARTGGPAPARSGRLREGSALIARARATGVWSAAERDELRALLPRLVPAERGEVLRSLARAMNQGEFVLQGIARPQ